jgi:hypothetical protein
MALVTTIQKLATRYADALSPAHISIEAYSEDVKPPYRKPNFQCAWDLIETGSVIRTQLFQALLNFDICEEFSQQFMSTNLAMVHDFLRWCEKQVG